MLDGMHRDSRNDRCPPEPFDQGVQARRSEKSKIELDRNCPDAALEDCLRQISDFSLAAQYFFIRSLTAFLAAADQLGFFLTPLDCRRAFFCLTPLSALSGIAGLIALPN